MWRYIQPLISASGNRFFGLMAKAQLFTTEAAWVPIAVTKLMINYIYMHELFCTFTVLWIFCMREITFNPTLWRLLNVLSRHDDAGHQGFSPSDLLTYGDVFISQQDHSNNLWLKLSNYISPVCLIFKNGQCLHYQSKMDLFKHVL